MAETVVIKSLCNFNPLIFSVVVMTLYILCIKWIYCFPLNRHIRVRYSQFMALWGSLLWMWLWMLTAQRLAWELGEGVYDGLSLRHTMGFAFKRYGTLWWEWMGGSNSIMKLLNDLLCFHLSINCSNINKDSKELTASLFCTDNTSCICCR